MKIKIVDCYEYRDEIYASEVLISLDDIELNIRERNDDLIIKIVGDYDDIFFE